MAAPFAAVALLAGLTGVRGCARTAYLVEEDSRAARLGGPAPGGLEVSVGQHELAGDQAGHRPVRGVDETSVAILVLGTLVVNRRWHCFWPFHDPPCSADNS